MFAMQISADRPSQTRPEVPLDRRRAYLHGGAFPIPLQQSQGSVAEEVLWQFELQGCGRAGYSAHAGLWVP